MPAIKMISPYKQAHIVEHVYYSQVEVINGECIIPESLHQDKSVGELLRRGYTIYEEPKVPEVRESPIEIIKRKLELEQVEAKPTETEMMKIPIKVKPDEIVIQKIDEEDKSIIDRKAEDSEWCKLKENRENDVTVSEEEVPIEEPKIQHFAPKLTEEELSLVSKFKKTYKIEEYDSDERLTKPVKKRGRKSKKALLEEERLNIKNQKCRAAGCRKWAMKGKEYCYKHSKEEVTDKKIVNYPNLPPDTDF